MIRRVQFSLNEANQGKLDTLDKVFKEGLRVVNLYIDHLWEKQDFASKFVTVKVETWMSARMQQCLGKQALAIVKSQRKRRKKTKPVLTRNVLNLDSRFLETQFDLNSFDVWFKLGSIGNKISLRLPSKKHAHFHNKMKNGGVLKKSCRLIRREAGYFVELFVEKVKPLERAEGKTVGLDCGYKTMLADSEGVEHGVELEAVYEKIARKKQGSKAFKRSLVERNNTINRVVNKMSFKGVKALVVEDLKNVKKNSKGRIRKTFNNKLQRWSYVRVLHKLALVCEELGLTFEKVNPAYTSQTCSLCGHVAKASRKGKSFSCVSCGHTSDADLNAAVNIRNRGTYSFPALQPKQ